MTIIDELNAEIEQIQERIKDIQDKCSHPDNALHSVTFQANEDEYGKTLGPGRYSYKCGLSES